MPIRVLGALKTRCWLLFGCLLCTMKPIFLRVRYGTLIRTLQLYRSFSTYIFHDVISRDSQWARKYPKRHFVMYWSRTNPVPLSGTKSTLLSFFSLPTYMTTWLLHIKSALFAYLVSHTTRMLMFNLFIFYFIFSSCLHWRNGLTSKLDCYGSPSVQVIPLVNVSFY